MTIQAVSSRRLRIGVTSYCGVARAGLVQKARLLELIRVLDVDDEAVLIRVNGELLAPTLLEALLDDREVVDLDEVFYLAVVALLVGGEAERVRLLCNPGIVGQLLARTLIGKPVLFW